MFFTSSWSPNKSTPQTAPSEWWRLSCAGYRPHGGPQPTHIPCFLRENLGKPGKTHLENGNIIAKPSWKMDEHDDLPSGNDEHSYQT